MRSVEELERLLAKAEMAIDAQNLVITALQEQVAHLQAGGGGLDDEGGGLELAAPSGAALLTDGTAQGGGMRLADAHAAEASPRPSPPEYEDADDTFVRPRHRSPRRNSGLDALSVAQLVELTSLREEVDRLRVQVATDAEELGEREEELKALQGVLEAKQQLIGRLLAEHDAAFAAAREQGVAEARRESLAGLRAFSCSVCSSSPFNDLLDIQGVGVLHTALCFQLHEARAACSRVEERASVLQSELHDLKSFVSANQVQQQTRGGAGRHGGDAGGGGGGGGQEAPRAADGEVVEVKVVQDLQGKLATLIHVHRQLLRKYAVVDVECGEMAEAVKVRQGGAGGGRGLLRLRGRSVMLPPCPPPHPQARDERIGELTKAQLSYNANLVSLKDQYDSRITELIKDHDDQLAALRSALSRAMVRGAGRAGKDGASAPLSLPPLLLQPKPLTTSRRMAAAGGGGGGEGEEPRSSPSTPPTSARGGGLGGATFWDVPGGGARGDLHGDGGPGGSGGPHGGGAAGSYASPPILTPGTTRSRHVVKPIRGQQADAQQHAAAAAAGGAGGAAGNLSFSLLRTPRGGVAPDPHRTPRVDHVGGGGSGYPPARLADVPDGDEDADD